jgi:hypothetical protein
MQPKTDKTGSKTGRPFGWFGLLMIAIISGLVVKVVGDPLVKVVSPQVENALEDLQEFVHHQHWSKKLNKQIDRWIDKQLNH